jgi:hypothetical protein
MKKNTRKWSIALPRLQRQRPATISRALARRTGCGLNRSTSRPLAMTDMEYPIRKAVKMEETAARLQPNSCWIGLKNTPKVQKVSPRVRVRQKQAPTISQP